MDAVKMETKLQADPWLKLISALKKGYNVHNSNLEDKNKGGRKWKK